MDNSLTGLFKRGKNIIRLFGAAITGDLNLFKKHANQLNESNNLAQTVATTFFKGRTVLHAAATAGQTQILKYLIEELKMDINVTDHEGSTPLHLTIQQNHYPATVYLLGKGANPNVVNDAGFTALHCAALEGSKKLVKLIISKGAEVDANPNVATPLQFAVAKDKKDSVKVLLRHHANPNASPFHTVCPLALAIVNGSIECVKLLFKAGADPNISLVKGTPLNIAVLKGDVQIVKCLLNAGADPDALNDSGLTAIETAAINNDHNLVATLLPLTSRISTFPDWSVDGIVVHANTEEANEMREQKLRESFLQLKFKGAEAVKKMDYHDAIKWYTKAITCKPEDASVLSNRSFCWTRLKEGLNALDDAINCVMLKPDWSKGYYRLGMARKVLMDFEEAADAFYRGWKLDLESKELKHAFNEAMEALRKAKHG